MTIGSPLTGEFTETVQLPYTATAVNTALGGPGTHVTSPVDGVVVRWRGKGTSFGVLGAYYVLEVLKPLTTSTYEVTAESGFELGEEGVQTYAAHLPIEAGELIGLRTLTPNAAIPVREEGGSEATYLGLSSTSGRFTEEEEAGEEVGVNADVQAPPTLTALAPQHGPPAGGTAVKILGTELDGATAVEFGGEPAQSFTVDSGGQITAVAPSGALGTSVDVTVTTPAGETPEVAAGLFTYSEPEPELPSGSGTAALPASTAPTASSGGTAMGPPAPHCVVPNLAGKKFAAAMRNLRKADCKIGKVKKTKKVTVKSGKVKKQSPKAGKVLAPGSKVGVKLG